MVRILAGVMLSAALAVMPAAAEEAYGPSFDCDKARTAIEKAICDAPLLGWYDRQLAKTWGLVKKATPKAGEAALQESQAAFLKSRDACLKTDNLYDCMAVLYIARIRTLADGVDDMPLFVDSYAAENGGVDIVRYPDNSAAMTISTIGGGDHTCGFETDEAKTGKGSAVTWSEKPDDMYAAACTITATPSADEGTLVVTAVGNACTYYCGVRAELSGTFSRK
ncbi:MAG: lysozyme inhibitor LprI family protein [Micropepsaceae bacterium]